MLRTALLAFVVSSLVGCAGLRPAPPPEFSATLPSRVHAAQDAVNVAQDVARLVPAALAHVHGKLGYAPRNFSVLVCRSECFTRHVRVAGAAAAAINDQVFVNADLAPTTDLQGVLAHELAHVLISELRGRELRRVPEWANEGLAVWASGVGTEGCAGAIERVQGHHLCVARRAADWLGDGKGEAQRCWLKETLTGKRDPVLCPDPVVPVFLAGPSPIPRH